MRINGDEWNLGERLPGGGADRLLTNPGVFLRDGRTFCAAHGSNVTFYCQKGTSRSISIDDTNSPITALCAVFPDKGVVCAGKEDGRLCFFDERGMKETVSGHPHPVLRLRLCDYRPGHFTVPFASPVLIALYPHSVILQVFLADVVEIRFTKWKLPHPNPVDSVIVNANTAQPAPTIFSIGARPFVSVCSISSDILPAKTSPGLFGLRRSSEHIAEAHTEWTIEDERRVACSLAINEEGRWLAVTDAQGRVTIIDCVFGQVTKIMKGMRDAQVAWARLNLLLIYAPARGMIVACTVPHGEIFAAVKVDNRGKLVQHVAADKELKVLFIDSQARVAQIGVQAPPPRNAEPPQFYHFTSPPTGE
jgi:hypothetical protein